jgi:hypothetical protein
MTYWDGLFSFGFFRFLWGSSHIGIFIAPHH